MTNFQYISDVHLEMMNNKIDYETIIKPIDPDKTGYLALAGGTTTGPVSDIHNYNIDRY